MRVNLPLAALALILLCGGIYGLMSDTVSYGINAEYEYRGRRFSFEPRNGDREYWEAKIRRFYAGSPVNVYYDPHNPENSVLETGEYE